VQLGTRLRTRLPSPDTEARQVAVAVTPSPNQLLQDPPPQPRRVVVGVRAARECVLAQRAETTWRKCAGLSGPTGVACHVEENLLDDVTHAGEGLVDGSRHVGTEPVFLDTGRDEGKEAGHLRIATLDH
jgi:hypothetical protein